MCTGCPEEVIQFTVRPGAGDDPEIGQVSKPFDEGGRPSTVNLKAKCKCMNSKRNLLGNSQFVSNG